MPTRPVNGFGSAVSRRKALGRLAAVGVDALSAPTPASGCGNGGGDTSSTGAAWVTNNSVKVATDAKKESLPLDSATISPMPSGI